MNPLTNHLTAFMFITRHTLLDAYTLNIFKSKLIGQQL